jgi:hypothetical protein
MCVAVLRRHLLAVNAVAIALDFAFLLVSAWAFGEIASALAATVSWFYLAVSFSLPICIPLYAVGERLVRRDCVRHAVHENAAVHAYGRVRHAWMAAFWNSFGASALIFWAPFYVDAIDAPAHLAPDVVWQRLVAIPSTLTFGIVYLLTVLWNLTMQELYMAVAADALRVIVDDDDNDRVAAAPRPRKRGEMNEVRELGTGVYTFAFVGASGGADLLRQ